MAVVCLLFVAFFVVCSLFVVVCCLLLPGVTSQVVTPKEIMKALDPKCENLPPERSRPPCFRGCWLFCGAFDV